MNDASPDIDTIYKVIQDEFDHLDQQIGRSGNRRLAITEFPQPARDLYLVHDIVAITCNAGMGAWIAYHHNEPGWVASAEEAFVRIGYPQVSAALKSCLAIYLLKGDSMTYKDDEAASDSIIDDELEIMRALHRYLVGHHFSFLPPEDRHFSAGEGDPN